MADRAEDTFFIDASSARIQPDNCIIDLVKNNTSRAVILLCSYAVQLDEIPDFCGINASNGCSAVLVISDSLGCFSHQPPVKNSLNRLAFPPLSLLRCSPVSVRLTRVEIG